MEKQTNFRNQSVKLTNETKYSDVSKGYVPGMRISRKIFKSWGKKALNAATRKEF